MGWGWWGCRYLDLVLIVVWLLEQHDAMSVQEKKNAQDQHEHKEVTITIGGPYPY